LCCFFRLELDRPAEIIGWIDNGQQYFLRGGKKMAANELKEILARKVEIRSALQSDAEVDLEALKTELEALNAKEEEIRNRKDIAEKINIGDVDTEVIKNLEVRTKMENNDKMKDWGSSEEYRAAFAQFVSTGEMPEEFRAVAMTAGNSAVMPVPTINKIQQKLENFGNILPMVTRVSYPNGAIVPTSQLGSLAVWTNDNDMATKGIGVDGKTTGSISFTAYPLVKAVGISFMANLQTLSAFETALVDEVSRAMGKALEMAIVQGTGHGQPKGILAATPAATYELSSKLGFKDLVKIKQSIPAMYRDGAVLLMNESTFFELYSIVDANGQPIARVNQGVTGAPTYNILGTQVVCTDFMPDYASATSQPVIVAMQMDKYILNCAYNIDLVTYQEQTTRNKVYQSVGVFDGLVADENGILFVNKPAVAKA
jgi:HK97 family phage major capsid protein